MARLLGYARPSISEPDSAAQQDRLRAAGIEELFVEPGLGRGSRYLRERQRLLRALDEGDIVVVASLDRIGTSLEDILALLVRIVRRKAHLHLLDEGVRTDDIRSGTIERLILATHSATAVLRGEKMKGDLQRARSAGGRTAGTTPRLTAAMWPDIERRLASEELMTVAADLGVRRQTLWSFRRRMEREAMIAGDRSERLHPRKRRAGSTRSASAKAKT